MRASLYVRLSRAADDANMSLEGMTQETKDFAARHGFIEVACHVDNGLSGGYRDRPEFMAWMADATEGRADVLIAYSVDRMTREGIQVAGPLLDVVEGKNFKDGRPSKRGPVRLMDTQGLDSAGDREAFRWSLVVKAEVARAERDRMSFRSKQAQRRLRRAGRWAGGAPPYGYQVTPLESGGFVLTVNPEEASAVREAASRVLQGQPLGRVARWMSDNHPPRRTAAWSRVALRQVLTGDAVLGRMTHEEKVLRDAKGRAFTPFEPILTIQESTELIRLLAQVKRKDGGGYKGGRKPSRLLSGVACCHSCGRKMIVVRRGELATTYRCQNRSDGGDCKNAVVVTAEPLERYVVAEMLGELGELPVWRAEVVVEDDGLAMVEDAIAATTASLAQAATAEAFTRLQALQAERDAIAARPAQVEEQTFVRTGLTFRDVWHEAAPGSDEQRDLLVSAIERVVVLPGRRGPRFNGNERVDIVWRTEPGARRGVRDGKVHVWMTAEASDRLRAAVREHTSGWLAR